MSDGVQPVEEREPRPERSGVVELGANIRARRIEHGMSLRELARRIGISASALSQIEIGRSRPNVKTLYSLSQHLGATPNEIFFGDGDSGLNSQIATPEGRLERSSDQVAAHSSINPHSRSSFEDVVELVRRGSQQFVELSGGETCRQIGGQSLPGVDCLLIAYEAGAVSPSTGERVTHVGREFNYLLSGSLTVDVDGALYDLWPGDSLTFSSERPHRFYNKGEIEAQVVCIVLRTWIASHGRID